MRHAPSFRFLWAGQTASQLGEHSSLTVLPLLAVLTLHVDESQLGLLRAVGQAPLLLITLFAGVWVDRWRATTVMVVADVGRALALSCFFLPLDLTTLLVAAFTIGTMSVFFDVAYQTSLVRLVARDRLLYANSALEASRSAASIGGPALGGSLTTLLPPPLAAAANALFFAASALFLGRVREPATVRAPHVSGPTRFVATDARLRAICLASAAFNFFQSAMMTGYLLFLPRTLHLPAALIGVILAAVGPGALLGSLLAARLPARLGHGRVIVGAALVGDGVMLAVPALHGDSWPAVTVLLAVNLVFGALGQLVNVTLMAVRQSITPIALQGRVAATITFAGMGMTPLGSLVGGYLAGHWSPRSALLLTAAGMLLSPLLLAASPLARLGRTL